LGIEAKINNSKDAYYNMINSLLDNIQSLITLSEAEKDIVTSLFKEKTYKKGDFFLADGQICKQVGFVTKGLMRYYINHDGEEKTYAFSQENQYVCNYESFLPQSPSSKIIQALEDSIVFVISHSDLQLLYANVREGERFGRIAIEAVFLQILKDINSFYTEKPEVRYERFLTNHPDLQQRISQYHIASFVGVKPQSLSRIRKRNLNRI
jgi:CRP-like cAMP-binding protein